MMYLVFFFQAEDGIRYLVRSRGLGDVYKRQAFTLRALSDRRPIGQYAGREKLMTSSKRSCSTPCACMPALAMGSAPMFTGSLKAATFVMRTSVCAQRSNVNGRRVRRIRVGKGDMRICTHDPLFLLGGRQYLFCARFRSS